MDLAQLWASCRAGDAGSRGALIERYSDLAIGISRCMRIPPSSLADRDDVASAAMIGLIAAVDRFDPRRGVPFEAYASLRIRGAVVDELRRVDERGRADRRPEGAELAVSLDVLLESGAHQGPVVDDGFTERYENEDLKTRIHDALGRLPARQREVIARYYGDELTLREAGAKMGVSEARACQLHGRAIQNLRRELSVQLTAAPARVAQPIAA
ncbi:MAG TPA: sigma-70 family RNA polymerase sigma factor [Candidatus Limnocylindria bacterium]|nr:sigma-70 family RNA polymerase sigma factor [Candidatus Limnocylindria bacterium]